MPAIISAKASSTRILESPTADTTRATIGEKAAQSQETQDVIMLKGGSNIRGKILKYEPLTVQLADSSFVTLNMNDVISITRESSPPKTAPSRPPSAREPSRTAGNGSSVLYRDRRNAVTIYGGVGLPVGDFGESSPNVRNAGFARTGFAVGMEWNSDGEIIQALIGTVVSFNSSEFGGAIAGLGGTIPSNITVDVESGSWTGIWPMIGVRAVGEISGNLWIHAEGLLGALIGFSPEIIVTARNNTGQSASATVDRATAVAVAYGGGIGITISHFDLSVRYFAGSPEYEFKSGGQTLGKGQQPSSLILATVGIRF